MDTIGKRIKFARALKGCSQVELSELCGWEHQSRISGYERDKREPDKKDIEKLAAVLGVRPCWLFFGDGAMTHDEAVPQSRKALYQLVMGLSDVDAQKAEALFRTVFQFQETEQSTKR